MRVVDGSGKNRKPLVPTCLRKCNFTIYTKKNNINIHRIVHLVNKILKKSQTTTDAKTTENDMSNTSWKNSTKTRRIKFSLISQFSTSSTLMNTIIQSSYSRVEVVCPL